MFGDKCGQENRPTRIRHEPPDESCFAKQIENLPPNTKNTHAHPLGKGKPCTAAMEKAMAAATKL